MHWNKSDPLHPLLELRISLIFQCNLDEFFEIRAGEASAEQVDLGNESRSPDGLTHRQVLDQIFANCTCCN